MLHLLHPAALWTLVALALPLAIHLRRSPPRTVRLGSLRFLENTPRRPLRNLRWRELLLLCTRLGLLALLSVLLTAPRWLVRPPPGPRQWTLLDPTAALAGKSLMHWHEAQTSGDELRYLAAGFSPVKNVSSPEIAANAAAPDLWSLLREADAELPDGSTLDVFTPGRLAALRGIRPALVHCRVRWFQTPDAAGDAAHVWRAADLGKQIIEGRSDAHSTTFVVRPRDEADLNATPAVSVLILHDSESTADARYVEAAVRAVADTTGNSVHIQNRDITPDAENAATADWTFWLSTHPVPEGLEQRAPRIILYAGGDTVTALGQIVAPSSSADGVRFWKRTLVSPPGPTGAILWRDGQGNPVLTYSRPAGMERWSFCLHFAPDWTDLPDTTALPGWLRELLFPRAALSGADPANDHRLADPSQSHSSELPAVAAIPALAPADQPAWDLHWSLWALAASLFVAERILSLLPRPSVSRSVASDASLQTMAASR